MSKYDRLILGRNAKGEAEEVTVDVYRVIEAFGVTSAPLQHLIKKALCAGLRGHKDYIEDLGDIIASARQALEIEREHEEVRNRPAPAPVKVPDPGDF